MFRPPPSIGLRENTPKRKCWPDHRFRATVRTVITSHAFSNFILLVILMNAITIALEADFSLKNSRPGAINVLNALNVLDYIFLLIYTVESSLKLYVYQASFWQNASYVFEVLILLIMLLQIIINKAGVGKDDGTRVIVDILNIFKAVRIFRAVILFEGVQVLLTALLNTVLKSAGSVSVLLIMLWVFFAVVGYYSFGYDDDDEAVYDAWGTFGNAIITLLTYLFAEGWVGIQKDLNARFAGSEFYAIIFITFAHFIFINLFIGIIIMNIHDATERHSEAQRKERDMQLQLKKEYLYKRQHDDVHRMLEKQKTHQYDNFQEMTRGFFETLSNDDYVLMSDVSANLMWLETFIDSLQRMDVYTYRAQQCHRNISIVLAEMAERHYKKQYGLLLPTDELSFDPYNRIRSTSVSFNDDVRCEDDDEVLKDGRSMVERGSQVTFFENESGEGPSKDTRESISKGCLKNMSGEPFSTAQLQRRFSEGPPVSRKNDAISSAAGDLQIPLSSRVQDPNILPSVSRGMMDVLPVPTIVLEGDFEDFNSS